MIDIKPRTPVFAIGRIPLSEEYATAQLRLPDSAFWTCSECHRVHRHNELQKDIEWFVRTYAELPKEIGDFVWFGNLGEVAVTCKVKKLLEAYKCDVTFRSIAVLGKLRLRSSHRPRGSAPQNMQQFDSEVELFELLPQSICQIDLEDSRVKVLDRCGGCGLESIDTTDAQPLPMKRVSWNQSSLFRTSHLDLIFVTAPLADAFRGAGFTNWSIIREGEIR